MAKMYPSVALGDLVSFKTGKLDSNAATPKGSYPFFTCAQETYRTDTFSFDCECVLLAGNNAAGVYPLKYFSGKFDAYQRTYVIRTLDEGKLLNRFLYFALRPKLEHVKSISSGAATKFLTLTLLKGLEVELHPLETQRKIASILSAYDDLIENNTRRINILEAMAQAIYSEWFVNFRFPGHEKVRMVDSPLGRVPEGWEVVPLKAIVENRRNATSAGEHLGGREYVPIDCLSRKSLALQESKPWEEAQSSLILFKKGDVLFGAMRSYFHKVTIAPFDGVTRTT
jgi:type I restriction enzyme S subunit